VTSWYGITNPVSWAIYLSIGIEIAALSALAAISANMGKVVYVPFGIVTFIQFLGNIFFAYQFIDVNSKIFLDWVEMVDPVVSYLGVESGNVISHKRFLALFAGGMLPLISLSFLHMLVKFEQEGKKTSPQPMVNIDEISKEAGRKEAEIDREKYTPTEKDLQKLEEVLNQIQKNEEIEDPTKINRLTYTKP
jgi:phosphoglycerol transferase MdoB-like AlkP superfamily enzyme